MKRWLRRLFRQSYCEWNCVVIGPFGPMTYHNGRCRKSNCGLGWRDGGKVPRPHPKGYLCWPDGKPAGGAPPLRKDGSIDYIQRGA